MENEITSLDDEEQEIIRKHRQEKARVQRTLDFRLKSINVAGDFEKWMQENGQGNSYSTFVNTYGYQEPDSHLMHDHVSRILKAATLG